jgi:programmed cell death 6-interacting protein
MRERRSSPSLLLMSLTTHSTSNIVYVPLRGTVQTALGAGLTAFVSSALGQHPEQFREGLAALEHLRAEIVGIGVHVASLQALIRYHAELVALDRKLPIDVRALMDPLM